MKQARITLWVIEHPEHGMSIRTSKVREAIPQPAGWRQTKVTLRPKAVAKLRKMLAEPVR